MKRWTFTPPPNRLRRRTVRLDNVAIVPASLLPYKREWQAVANRQPPGCTLIVIPIRATRQRAACEGVANDLAARGKQVLVLAADLFPQA